MWADILTGIFLPIIAAALVYFVRLLMKKNPVVTAIAETQELHHKALNQILIGMDLPPMDVLKRDFENEANFLDVFFNMIEGLGNQYKDNPILNEMKNLLKNMRG